MDASRATSYRGMLPGRRRARSVPARDHRPAIGAADLRDDPGIHLTLLVVRRRRDAELVEQAALDGVVVLEEGMVRDSFAIRLDGLQHRAAHVPEAARQDLAHALADLGQRVERTIGEG